MELVGGLVVMLLMVRLKVVGVLLCGVKIELVVDIGVGGVVEERDKNILWGDGGIEKV